MSESSAGFLQWDDYVYVLDFYERNHIEKVSLLGGEPTIHPHVTTMVDYALQRGFDVRMFTSGVTAPAVRERLLAVADKHTAHKINFIVNVNHPSMTKESELKSQVAFLEHAGARASLSFNIYRPDFDLDFTFDYIARYDLSPTLRLGLAHPISMAKGENSFIAPAQYRAAADNLARYFPKFERCRVVPGFDCGFPMCMFTDEQLGALTKLRSTHHWSCGPVVDIGPDLDVWPCFPLSHMRGKSLYEFDTLEQIMNELGADVRARKKGNTGVYVECDGCSLRDRDICGGGCVTYLIPQGTDAQSDHSPSLRNAPTT
jgi:radical SAM protein with 4Fe4S-binding SPASM domain